MSRRFLRPGWMALVAAFAVTVAHADRLRNLAPGDPIPDFSLPTLDGGPIARGDLAGRAAIIVFVSAEQARSGAAAHDARAVWSKVPDDVALVLVTTDADRAAYFRRQREGTIRQPPLAFDAERRLYGALGLIVLPTTIIVDAEGRLAHVMASHTPGYEHSLTAYVDHARGIIDADALAVRLTAVPDRGLGPEALVARHRATARVLRDSGLDAPAEAELRAALALDPRHVDTRLDLAALLLAAGESTEARAQVDAALTEAPSHRRGQLVHGALLFEEGKLAEARRTLEGALVRNADPAWTHYYLGRIREAQGDAAAALNHYREALDRTLGERPL